MTKKLIDRETLCAAVRFCAQECNQAQTCGLDSAPCDCPIWAGLEEVPKAAREIGLTQHGDPPPGQIQTPDDPDAYTDGEGAAEEGEPR